MGENAAGYQLPGSSVTRFAARVGRRGDVHVRVLAVSAGAGVGQLLPVAREDERFVAALAVGEKLGLRGPPVEAEQLEGLAAAHVLAVENGQRISRQEMSAGDRLVAEGDLVACPERVIQ